MSDYSNFFLHYFANCANFYGNHGNFRMSFKILQTNEQNKDYLSIVPHLWEVNGFVKWPAKSQMNTKSFIPLVKNPDSVPDANWTSHKCVVKRRDVATYELAEIQVDQMSDQTDSSEVDSLNMPAPSRDVIKRRSVMRDKTKRNVSLDFSSLVTKFNFLHLSRVLYC